MKIFKRKYIILLFPIFMTSCRRDKHINNPCEGKVQTVANFETYEIFSDTLLAADTMFNNNIVKFKALDNYDTSRFNLSGDPRTFENSEFHLRFPGFTGNITVDFTAKKTPNTSCFPNDPGVYYKSKQIRLVEPYDRATLTLSPLIGKYKGAYDISPMDSFIVRIEYFDSAKYIPTMMIRNFYWVSNFPKGFVTNLGNVIYNNYTELMNGYRPDDLAYKAFKMGSFNISNFGLIKGFLSKSNDTLIITNSGADVPARKFVGKRI